MSIWALCTSVCASPSAAKINPSPLLGPDAKDGIKVAQPKAAIKGSRLTVTGGDGSIAQAVAAAAQEEQPFERIASDYPVSAELEQLDPSVSGALLPPFKEFPTPKDLVDQVQEISQIFNLVEHKFCVCGITTVLSGNKGVIEKDFSEKKLEISGATDPVELQSTLQKLGITIRCKKGRKPESPNQDNVFFCQIGDISICGVADGHGPDGHWASHWIARLMLRLLMPEVSAAAGAPGDETLTRIFSLTHDALCKAGELKKFDTHMSGSTLSICIIDHAKRQVVSAWVGDSRCAIVRPGGVKGTGLTTDHKPQDPEEKARIRQMGGEVVRLENDVPHRVFIKGGEIPGLAMSRAMGDCIAHSVGVIHTPGIMRVKLEDHCVLCCSDGVWEFIESDEGGQMVSTMGRDKVVEATEKLCLESRKRWLDEEQSMTDDISAICIWI